MSAPQQNTGPVTVAVIDLAKHAGGFVAIDLVAHASLEILAQPTLVVSGTTATAEVTFSATNLPKNSKLPCKVQWRYRRGDKTIDVEGPPAEMDVPGGKVTAVLDLMSAGPDVGYLLARGGPVTLVLTPDWPYVDPALIEMSLGKTLALRLGDSAGKKELGARDGEGAGWNVGEPLVAELVRGGWTCPARLRVDTPGDTDLTLDWAAGAAGPLEWQLGLKDGTLQLPTATYNKPAKRRELALDLYLEVTNDGTTYAPVQTAKITLTMPELKDFKVTLGGELLRMFGVGVAPAIRPDGTPADIAVMASGKFTGFVAGFDPPFSLELWLLAKAPKGPSSIHPAHDGPRTPIGALAPDGSFFVVLDYAADIHTAAEYIRLTPFAVLRAASKDFPKIEPNVSAWGHRGFSDEDLAPEKTSALGLCSREITKDLHASRQPVVGALTHEIVGEGIRLKCGVLGPQSYWKSVKPKMTVTDESAKPPTTTTIDAAYEGVKDSMRGSVVGTLAMKSLGKLAGKKVKVELVVDAKKKGDVVTPAGAGVLEMGPIQPELLRATWVPDEDPKKHTPRIRVTCALAWFPKKSKELVVQLGTPTGEGPAMGWTPFDAKPTFEHAGQAASSGSADDEGIELFITDPAKIVEAQTLLGGGKLHAWVARPTGGDNLYDNPDFKFASATKVIEPGKS